MKWVIVGLLFLTVFPSVSLAAKIKDVGAGWREVQPGQGALCGRGAEYSFFVRPGSSNRLAIVYSGGGACWDSMTCENGTQSFRDTVDYARGQINNAQGIYNFRNPKNPYKDWTLVIVPYCTADLHLGNKDVTYTHLDGSDYVIHHRGGTNAKVTMQWVTQNLSKPKEVLVAGCSAGAYATAIWTPQWMRTYPQARFHQLGDSGAGAGDAGFFADWNVEATWPAFVPGLELPQDWSKLNLVDVYNHVARFAPQTHFSAFNYNNDRIQKLFYFLTGGGSPSEWQGVLYKNMDKIAKQSANFNYYVAEGNSHCALMSDRFYTEATDGVAFKDWMQDLRDGRGGKNVLCPACHESVTPREDTVRFDN